MKTERVLAGKWYLREEGKPEQLEIPAMPMQVHDILYYYGKIGEGYRFGKTVDCGFVNDKTWVYETEFYTGCGDCSLLLGGLDTLAEIRVNNQTAGKHEDSYLPCNLDITPYIKQGKNTLEIFFCPVKERIEKIQEQYGSYLAETSVDACRFIRKTFHDFTTYLGNDDNFYKVGIYRDVVLTEYPEGLQIGDVQIDYTLNERLTRARIRIVPDITGKGEVYSTDAVKIQISYKGNCIWEQEKCSGSDFFTELSDIHLWWPVGYGEACLYDVKAVLIRDGCVIDRCEKRIGIRKITMQGMLDFQINGMTVKLWGANLTPDQGYTLCEDSVRIQRLLSLALEANVNTIRIWGEGVPFTDLLYDFADEHGLLLWQEFFCGHARYPDVDEVKEKILAEAEYMIKSKRHHPSILLWCGGNECYLCRDFAAPEEEYHFAEFLEYTLKKLCYTLDPDRYYHVNSPFGGSYSNEPRVGDTHSYTNSWYVPGSDYPIFASENLRVSFPREKSLKRYLRTEKLPAPGIRKHGDLPWPEEYEAVTSAESYKKIPAVEEFYDASTSGEMIYRFGAAAGKYIKESVERYRRGRSPLSPTGERICKGHFIWKWNTTFPHIYSSVLDAYLEQKMPYYDLKRAYKPLSVQVEVSDYLYAWAVNDTGRTVQGFVKAELFDMAQNRIIKTQEMPVKVYQGESVLAGRLDRFGEFTRDKIIKVSLCDEAGEKLAENHAFVDIERHLTFPETTLSMWEEDGKLCVTSTHFARCVELTGEEDGDEYWWDFQDNYFDLFPGEVKKISFSRKHKKGAITAKAFYSKEDSGRAVIQL